MKWQIVGERFMPSFLQFIRWNLPVSGTELIVLQEMNRFVPNRKQVHSFPLCPMIPRTQSQHKPISAIGSVAYPGLSQRITLVTQNRSILVSADDIVWLEGSGNYTFIHTRDKRRYLMAKTLKMFQQELTGVAFSRIHKSHVVNLSHVRTINFGDNACIELTGGQTLAIARRRLTPTLNQYLHHRQLTGNVN